MERERELSLEHLPVDVLFAIFQYLDLPSLAALASTCHTLLSLINDEYLHVKSFSLLVTNQFSVDVQKRSLQLLSSINKFRTNHKWRKKYYHEKLYLISKERFRPWLRLNENGLYVGRGREISLYQRNCDGVSTIPLATFSGHNDDITRFVVDSDILISGANDGQLCCWDAKSGAMRFHANNDVKWNESVYIDCQRRVLASGFNKACSVKFWLLNDYEFNFRNQVEQTERVWSVALNENATSCSIGSAGYTSAPLKIYDLNKEMYSLTMREKYKAGAGVFDAVWESSQVLISGGFDTYIRMWDLRIGECVQSWSDPYDAAIYSLATDNLWTILAGTAVNGRITLWDKRLPKCIQRENSNLFRHDCSMDSKKNTAKQKLSDRLKWLQDEKVMLDKLMAETETQIHKLEIEDLHFRSIQKQKRPKKELAINVDEDCDVQKIIATFDCTEVVNKQELNLTKVESKDECLSEKDDEEEDDD